MPKIKVSHIISSLNVGGVEKGIQLSVNALNEKIDYNVFTLSNNNSISLNPNYVVSPTKKYILFSFPSVIKELKKFNPDVIVVSLWRSVWIAILYKKFINKNQKLILFVHSEIFFHVLDKFFTKYLAKYADAVAFDSLNTANVQKSLIKNTRPFFLIPYVFPHNKGFTKRINSFEPLKFMFAGRIVPVKNLESVLYFFNQMKLQKIQFVFDIYGIGDAEYILQLQKLASLYDISHEINFRGYFDVDAAADIFNQYQFYIQFSKNEGMAMSVVDAMLYGLVPIVTAVGEIKNYVSHNDNGLILKYLDDKPDYDLLLNDLKVLINHPTVFNRLSENAINYFKDAKSYANAFCEMITSSI
jgi:glycosyltransferase involved in cell wall biosynthesis